MKDTGLVVPFADSGPPVPRGRLAVVLLLVAETMFFVGMLGAYVIVRKSAESWPPAYETASDKKDSEGRVILVSVRPPRMDTTLPLVNAGVLTAAMAAAFLAQRAAKRRDLTGARRGLAATAVFGAAFLAVVGLEFTTEAARGLTLWSGQYGSMLFLIIAVHAAHVFAGLVWHFFVLWPAFSRPAGVAAERLEYLGIYWGFVAILWWVLCGILLR